MIKQNQRQLNQLNGVLDAFVAFLAMMLAFVVRFYWMDDGVISYGVAFHVLLALVNALLHVVVYAAGSYTHLDVYKRQKLLHSVWCANRLMLEKKRESNWRRSENFCF